MPDKQWPTEKRIVDILTNEMDMDDQRVWVYSQNIKMPNDDGLFIMVGFQNATGGIIANNRQVIPVDEGMKEIITTVVREVIQIDIVSKNNDAAFRRYEVLQSLKSVYSVQQQEKFAFKIFSIPASFVNTGSAEGGSELNRFTINIICHSSYFKEKMLSSCEGDYYDKFDTRVDDEKTIGTDEGIIEFNITGEDIT